MNENKVEKILLSPAIVLENGKTNLKVEIIFEGGAVADVKSLVLQKENELGIEDGMSRVDVKNIILKLTSRGDISLAFNTLPDTTSRDLKIVSQADFDKFDHWGFSGASKFSYTKFNFGDGKLKSINNKWSLIELP